MAKRLFALVTMFLVTIFAFSICNAAVTYRTNDPDGSWETHIPYPAEDVFNGEIWLDTDAPISGLDSVMLYMEFDDVNAELTNPGQPFTIGSDFSGLMGLDNKVDGNKLILSLFSMPPGLSLDAGSYLIASVEFKKLTDGTKVPFKFAEDLTGKYANIYSIGGVEKSPDDLLVPNDLSLPVVTSAFTASVVDGRVAVKWSTESETNNLGFDVYRSESPDGKFVKINPVYIKGAGTDATPRDYKFVDESTVVGKTYYYYIESISFSGERERTHIIKVIIDASGKARVTGLMQPAKPALLQNFPNPFNPETWIPFHLADDADVTIRIFDIRGKQIRTIHLGRTPAGYYETRGNAAFWDGRDSYGQEVSSGIYFYNLTAGTFSATKKLTIIK